MTTAYCLRCRKKISLVSGRHMKAANGANYLLGKCPSCKGKVSLITSGGTRRKKRKGLRK